MANAENIAAFVKMHVANIRETEAVLESEKDIVRMLLAAKINEIEALKKEDREAEKAALRQMIAAKTVEINALKKEIAAEETNIQCIHCKKTNHASEQCFFRQGAKPAKSTVLTPPNAEFAPCKFCKKTNHLAEKCHFNPANVKASTPVQVPCKFCKKTNHTAEKCHFNPARKVQA
jgi:hypothetical protein